MWLPSTGSSSASTPATSLSSLTARTPITRVKPNNSVNASIVAAIPAGLCAASAENRRAAPQHLKPPPAR